MKKNNKLLIFSFVLLAFVLVVGGSVFLFVGRANNVIKSEADAVNETVSEESVEMPMTEISNSDNSDPTPSEEPSPDSFSSENVPVKSGFSFAVIGDTQRYDPRNPSGGFQSAVRNIADKKVDFIMTEGDLLSSCKDGCQAKLANWKAALGSLASKTYAVMGNHDRTGKKSADSAWQSAFALPNNGPDGYKELVYSFNFQDSHFVVLNSEKPKEHVINKIQRDWLEADLAANRQSKTFVFWHEPAYPVSSKIGESLDTDPHERNEFWKILVRYKVTAVFNGHEHIHSRKKIGDIYQFVFGNTDSFDHDLPKAGMAEYSFQGKSFGIVRVEDSKIIVELYTVYGKLQNSFTFSI